MAKARNAIPKGHHTVTPSLSIDGASKAITWYKKALGAKELSRMPGPGGKIMHAAIMVGNSVVFMADPWAEMKDPKKLGGSPVALIVYVGNCDALFKKAVDAGAKVVMPMGDQFWGDRAGTFTDPFGYNWMIMSHKEDLTMPEIAKRQKAFFKSLPKK